MSLTLVDVKLVSNMSDQPVNHTVGASEPTKVRLVVKLNLIIGLSDQSLILMSVLYPYPYILTNHHGLPKYQGRTRFYRTNFLK